MAELARPASYHTTVRSLERRITAVERVRPGTGSTYTGTVTATDPDAGTVTVTVTDPVTGATSTVTAGALAGVTVTAGADVLVADGAGSPVIVCVLAGGAPVTAAVPVLRYRADTLTGADGDLVTALDDTVTGADPLQPYAATSTYAPVLRPAALAGHSGIEFDASATSQALVIAPPADLGQALRETVVSGGFTLFIALANTAPAAGQTFLEMYDAPGGGGAFVVSDTLANLTTDGAAQILENHYPAGDYTGVPTLHEWRCDLTSWAYRRGGADVTPDDTTAPVAGVPGTLTFSTAVSPLKAGFSFTGVLYEVQLFSGALAGGQLTAARAYFAASYGLAA